MKEQLLAAYLATAILAGCTQDAVEPTRLDQISDSPECRLAIDYQSGAFALDSLKATLTFDAGYRVTRIDAVALDAPQLRRAGDDIALYDGFQHNLCLMMNLTQDDPAKRDGFQRRMLVARRRVACLMTKIQTLGARIRSNDVETCRSPS